MEALKQFLENVVTGRYTFGDIGAFFGGAAESIKNNQELATLGSNILYVFSAMSIIFPFILLALAVLQVMFGKKLLGISRFVSFFVVGYCVGVNFVSPIINEVLVLPNYLSGIVIALVASVLCRYLYFVFLAIGVWYSVYHPIISYVFPGNAFIALVLAVGIVVVLFIFRKYVEMVLSSLWGGYFVSLIIRFSYFDYVSQIGRFGWIPELIIVLAFGVFGSIYQIKHRTRY